MDMRMLEDYGNVWYYNSDTLEKIIDTVHKMHNTTTWNEKIFAGKPDH